MRAVPPADAAATGAQRRVQLAIYLFAVSPYLLNGWINPHFGDDPLLYWSIELLCWVVVPAIALMLAWKYASLDFLALGFTLHLIDRRSMLGMLLMCTLVSVLMVGLYELADHYSGRVFGTEVAFSYAAVMPAAGPSRVLVALYLALTAGFVEETLYRGFAYQLACRYAHPRLLYLTIGPAVFAAVHWEGGWASVSAAYVLGVFTALVFLALRNLWPLVVGHCVTDYLWFE